MNGSHYLKLQKVIYNLSLEQFTDMMQGATTKAPTEVYYGETEDLFYQMKADIYVMLCSMDADIVDGMFEYAEKKQIMYELSKESK